ncbi:hypothetical protein TIFTF001_003979 [Ficus carica]|uniref:Uncharacterized protein n=1 Tax=Ficus carica TaxID=3494 RepID=A0AA88CV76_FICCA|nr:hypothetical protein TIFTF001_003979 [Ficus carica]
MQAGPDFRLHAAAVPGDPFSLPDNRYAASSKLSANRLDLARKKPSATQQWISLDRGSERRLVATNFSSAE